MLRKYQVPFVLTSNGGHTRKIAIVSAETPYQAMMIVLGNYVEVDAFGVNHGDSLAMVDVESIVEVVEFLSADKKNA